VTDLRPQDMAQGSCVGYEVRSTVAFTTLRTGSGQPLLVDEHSDPDPQGEVIAEWHPRPGNPFHGRLLQNGRRYAFWASDAGWYLIDPTTPSISVIDGMDPLRRELRLFGIPAALCSFEAGDVSIHASAVEINGYGVLFAGPSRYGKTTLAAAFARAGHRLLSEDTSRCTLSPEPAVYPGPAMLRLRADVARRLHLPGSTVRAVREDRVSLVLEPDRRGDGASVPLRAVVILRPHEEGTTLAATAPALAARDLFALTFRPPKVGAAAACFSRTVDLAARVEVLDLRRRMTIEALDEVVSLVERHIGS
jgi:hypothetical protein